MLNGISRKLILSILAVLTLAGCASLDTKVNPQLQPIASTVLATKNMSTRPATIYPAQPEPYSSILEKKYSELKFGADNNLRNLEISRLGNMQSRLPQISPGASLGTNNALNLRVQQVVFDGGVYRAQFHADDHLAILRQIEFLNDLNKKSSDDIAIFLSYQKNVELEKNLMQTATYLGSLLNLATTRASGGVGDASDVSLFELKLSEIKAEASIARADAQSDLVALGVKSIKSGAVDFKLSDKHLPLSIVHAMAKLEHAKSSLELAKKQRIPKVVLEGRVGMDPFFGIPQSNVGLSIDKDPIAIGGNTKIMAARQNVQLENHNLEMATRDAQRETARIRARIAALGSQLAETDQLSQFARSRFDDFYNQFKAGTANLTEAVGLISTLRQSTEKKVTLKYQIFDLQRQLAEQGGHFWKFKA